MRRTISGDPADLKVKAKEKTYISAVPTNLCQGKTTMFLHCNKVKKSLIDYMTFRRQDIRQNYGQL